MMLIQTSSTTFAKLLVVATILPLVFGFPIGAPNCNDGNAAKGQGSYHDAPRGLLSNLGIAVCMNGTNVNTNETIHVEPNFTYTLTLQRSLNGGIEGIFVRLAPIGASETVEVIDADAVLSTSNPLLRVSTVCSTSATGITHTSKDRKPMIEITMDTTGLPIDSEYLLGITSVDSHDHAYTPYTIHVTDGKNHTTAAATSGTCQPVEMEATSGVNAICFSSYYYTAVLTMVGLMSTLVLA